jgi:hypothetical protein
MNRKRALGKTAALSQMAIIGFKSQQHLSVKTSKVLRASMFKVRLHKRCRFSSLPKECHIKLDLAYKFSTDLFFIHVEEKYNNVYYQYITMMALFH